MKSVWDSEISEAEAAWAAGQTSPLFLKLPGRGFLRVDRRLPFLALVRIPKEDPDSFPRLLGSAASCLVWDSEAMATEVEPPEVEILILHRPSPGCVSRMS